MTTKTPRQVNREHVTADIMDAARRQLADVGAAALSLRSVAREIGMVSSAVYRYVASRDELLTRLIIEAYDSLGAEAEAALDRSRTGSDVDRWLAVARSIREWATANPHQYLLLYGSPVPGYAAPDDTVVPGTRVTLALVSIVRDAHDAGRLGAPASGTTTGDDRPAVDRPAVDQPAVDQPGGDRLGNDLDRLGRIAGMQVGRRTTLAFLAAWTQLFGLISFELTNQTRGMVEQHAALFDATARLGAEQIGLR